MDLKRGLKTNDIDKAVLKFDKATRDDKGKYELVLSSD